MVSFSSRLRSLRGETRQADIAKVLGVSLQSYSAFENGREPSYSILMMLAEHFHVSIDYLIGASDHYTLDEAVISKVTGLDDVAIMNLEELKRQNRADLVNYIIGDQSFVNLFDYIELMVGASTDKDYSNKLFSGIEKAGDVAGISADAIAHLITHNLETMLLENCLAFFKSILLDCLLSASNGSLVVSNNSKIKVKVTFSEE